MTENSKPKTLAETLLAFQAEIPSLKLGKDSTGQAGNRSYRYLSLDKLHAEVLPVLNKHGMVWITRPLSNGPVLHYRLFLASDIEQGIEGDFPLILDKQNSQGLGSALTYARRYALTAVLGIVPDDDDYGAAASVSEGAAKGLSGHGTILMDGPSLNTLIKRVAEKNADLDLLLSAVGAESQQTLTVAQGRAMWEMLK